MVNAFSVLSYIQICTYGEQLQSSHIMGGSPADLCSRGYEFEFQPQILEGHFITIFVVKIVLFV